ncbi:hypothetical protein AAMO2058_000441200 [Amorphochlora amoebiformis]
MSGKRESREGGEGGEDLSLSQIEKKARSLLVFANAKAGTKESDRERINKVLYESSKSSAYFRNEERKAELVDAKLKKMKESLASAKSQDTLLSKFQAASTRRLVKNLRLQLNLFHTWIHIDMDMFFAAVEIRDNPSLKDKPVAIGGMGMISTTNYVARKYGVRSAMPGFMGKKLCPSLVFVKPNYSKYAKVAEKVREILRDYDPNFQSMSLDEASLDVTGYIMNHREELLNRLGTPQGPSRDPGDDSTLACTSASARRDMACKYTQKTVSNCEEAGRMGALIGEDIRRRVKASTRLTASAGIACTRTLAKICSDLNKPDGLYHLPTRREHVEKFLENLNVRKLPGVGKVTEKVLNELGITKCKSIISDKAHLVLEYFSKKTSDWLLRAATGVSNCRCRKTGTYEQKGIGNERTFKATTDPKVLRARCGDLCQMVGKRMEKSGMVGRVITLKLKDTKFVVHTRSATLNRYISSGDDLEKAALPLLDAELSKAAMSKKKLILRLMGVRMSTLIKKPVDSLMNTSDKGAEPVPPKPLEQFLPFTSPATLSSNTHMDPQKNITFFLRPGTVSTKKRNAKSINPKDINDSESNSYPTTQTQSSSTQIPTRNRPPTTTPIQSSSPPRNPLIVKRGLKRHTAGESSSGGGFSFSNQM